MMKTKEILTNIVAKHTGKKYKEALTDMERNKWMSPEEALAYGLIDKVIG
jgi:ATP-dependent Clp protease protease subunit